jgi:succinyl-CoA synthetase beta subunit
LPYDVARKTLDRYKIRNVETATIASGDDAVKFWGSRGMIVMKVISDKALHKSKSGLVALYLANPKQIRDAFSLLTKRASKLKLGKYKVVAQRMILGGTEIIVGGNTDSQFGKMVLLGLGGIYVEAFKDFALRICPINKDTAFSMIDQLKSSNVIAHDTKSREMIASLLLKASKLFAENDFTEMDLNPIILHDGTYDAVDLRLLSNER